MKTHIVYRTCGRVQKQYFSGIFNGELDKEKLPIIEFKWSVRKLEATLLDTPLAWDLMSMCRFMWPQITVDVERQVSFNNVVDYYIQAINNNQ